jgi:hypothetical protein
MVWCLVSVVGCVVGWCVLRVVWCVRVRSEGECGWVVMVRVRMVRVVVWCVCVCDRDEFLQDFPHSLVSGSLLGWELLMLNKSDRIGTGF